MLGRCPSCTCRQQEMFFICPHAHPLQGVNSAMVRGLMCTRVRAIQQTWACCVIGTVVDPLAIASFSMFLFLVIAVVVRRRYKTASYRRVSFGVPTCRPGVASSTQTVFGPYIVVRWTAGEGGEDGAFLPRGLMVPSFLRNLTDLFCIFLS